MVLFSVIVYLVGMLWIGYWAYKRTSWNRLLFAARHEA